MGKKNRKSIFIRLIAEKSIWWMTSDAFLNYGAIFVGPLKLGYTYTKILYT